MLDGQVSPERRSVNTEESKQSLGSGPIPRLNLLLLSKPEVHDTEINDNESSEDFLPQKKEISEEIKQEAK